MSHIADLSILEEKIGYNFKNIMLLEVALTHSSSANERRINKIECYERTEFLGDAVLELVSSDFVYGQNPDMNEGSLTKLRSSMVCEPALAYCARLIGLEQFIRLGKGEENTGGRDRDSIIADVMEAVIGAIYLDGGLEPASTYIHRFILSDLEDKILFYDSKTSLQELVQEDSRNELEYILVEEKGPDHNKEFTISARLNGKVIGQGIGKTKKAAEQKAAYEALKYLKK